MDTRQARALVTPGTPCPSLWIADPARLANPMTGNGRTACQ
ncbi:MAG: hypothetical protein ACYDBB_21505 [Armatimonadota bacterium]